MTESRGAVPQLVALLKEPPPMQGFCIFSLGRIGDPVALQPLLELWDGANNDLRQQLRLSIFQLRNSSAVPALLEPLRTYQPRPITNVYLISDSLEISSRYSSVALAPFLDSPLPEARRDALLLLATFGTKDDSALLQTFAENDADSLNREVANLGVERLKDIPLWERS